MDIDFSGLNTFSTPSKLTDLAQTNPANLRKKDVKHPLSYRYRITNQKPKILLVSWLEGGGNKAQETTQKQIH